MMSQVRHVIIFPIIENIPKSQLKIREHSFYRTHKGKIYC